MDQSGGQTDSAIHSITQLSDLQILKAECRTGQGVAECIPNYGENQMHDHNFAYEIMLVSRMPTRSFEG